MAEVYRLGTWARHGVRAERLARPVATAALASPFVVSGLGKAGDWNSAILEFEQLGIPYTPVALGAVIVTQLLGAVLLFWRRSAWLASAALVLFTLAATLIAHDFWNFAGPERARNEAVFFEHLAIIGGLIAVPLLHWSHERSGGAAPQP